MRRFSEAGPPLCCADRSLTAIALLAVKRDTPLVMRVAILEGVDFGWTGEASVDRIGLVLEDGREFWCG